MSLNVQLDRNQPRTPATDSRALQTLIKTEKTYVDDMLTATSAAISAASSLHAWGLSETPDLDEATGAVAHMLEAAANAQKTYSQALHQYRDSLKDMLDREQSIRSIVRDRDILMNRIIKYSQKKPSRWEMIKGEEEYQARIADTERELQACEQTLANETAALIGVKRRTFKEAFMMRAKTLGDMGAAMMDSARNMLMYLDSFDADIPVAPVPVTPHTSMSQAQPMTTYSQGASQNIFLPDTDTTGYMSPEPGMAPADVPPQDAYAAYGQEAYAQPGQVAYTQPGQEAYASYAQPGQDAQDAYPSYSQEYARYGDAYQTEQPVYQTEQPAYHDPSYAQDGYVSGRETFMTPEPQADMYAQDPYAYATKEVPGLPQDDVPRPRSRSRRPRMERASSASALNEAKPRKKSQHRSSSSMSFASGAANLPQVPGGVPSAPRLNLEHARDGFVAPTVPGGVPTAPRLFMHQANDEVASTADTSVVYRPTRRRNYADNDSDSDDDGWRRPRHQRSSSHGGASGGGGGFFSRVSNLFRSDLRGETKSSLGHRGGTDSLFSPMTERTHGGRASRSSRTRWTQGGESSDDEPNVGVVRHVNNRPGSSLQRLRSPVRTAEEQALDEAIRRSVIGAGIAPAGAAKRPTSRQSDAYGIGAGPPPSSVLRERASQRHSVEVGDSLGRPASAGATLRPRSSSEQIGKAKPKGKKKKKRDAGAHPPPAPSSYANAYGTNASKFETDSWVARPSSSMELSSAPARPRSAMSSSGRATPLKSAMKSKGTPASNKHISIIEGDVSAEMNQLTLDVDRQIDGTGHLDLNLGELSTTKPATPSTTTTIAPALSYLGQPVAPSSTTTHVTEAASVPHSASVGTDAAETYRAFLQADGQVPPAASPVTTLQDAQPPITSMPSLYGSTTTAAVASPVPAAELPKKKKKSAKVVPPSEPVSNEPAVLASSITAEAAARMPRRETAVSPAPLSLHPPPRPPRATSPNTRRVAKPIAPVTEEDSSDEGHRSTWTSRVHRVDDSSDEDEGGAGAYDGNDYNSARQAFGSATHHLGLATGSITPQP